jgi:hypothetical protein
MMRVIEDLAGNWRRLDERIEGVSTEIAALADQDPACERADDGARHWTDHLKREGRRDRQWLSILQGARLVTTARINPRSSSDFVAPVERPAPAT